MLCCGPSPAAVYVIVCSQQLVTSAAGCPVSSACSCAAAGWHSVSHSTHHAPPTPATQQECRSAHAGTTKLSVYIHVLRSPQHSAAQPAVGAIPCRQLPMHTYLPICRTPASAGRRSLVRTPTRACSFASPRRHQAPAGRCRLTAHSHCEAPQLTDDLLSLPE